jgi:hypothetical protein
MFVPVAQKVAKGRPGVLEKPLQRLLLKFNHRVAQHFTKATSGDIDCYP